MGSTVPQFKIVCSNGEGDVWENETHTDLQVAIDAARTEVGTPAFLWMKLKDGSSYRESIGNVTMAWVQDEQGEQVWPTS